MHSILKVGKSVILLVGTLKVRLAVGGLVERAGGLFTVPVAQLRGLFTIPISRFGI